MPVCPSGGLWGWATDRRAGLMKVAELFWQLRGELEPVRSWSTEAWPGPGLGDLMQVGTVIILGN
jgi:hypothetical protein